MKLITGIAALAIFGLTACNNSAKLAGEVDGTWSAPKTSIVFLKEDHKDKDHKKSKEDISNRPEMTPAMACAPTVTFTRTQGTNGGDISISATYEITQSVHVTDTVVPAPVKATINGTVTTSGTWQTKEDDEIYVTLDPAKTVIKTDLSSLTLNYATLTDASASGLDALKENVAGNIASTVTPMIQQCINKIHKLDDVKVNGKTMTMELGETKFNFSKQ